MSQSNIQSNMNPPPLPPNPIASTGPQRIPGFAESGFHALPMGPSSIAIPKSFDTAYQPRINSLGELPTYQRDPRTGLSQGDLRLNTRDAVPMYTFSANRSPLPSPDIHMSRQLGHTPIAQTPIEPSSASSTTSSIHSMKNIRSRQPRKLPSARPAAKRMRDTRDREGMAIQHMELDLEAEGRLRDLKPLNANNKEEAGRRYPKADVLERYCQLSMHRKEVEDERRSHHYASRKCRVLERWCERWSVSFTQEAREQLDAMVADLGSPEPSEQSVHTRRSFSGQSSFSEFEQSSATSAEWSVPDEHDYIKKGSRHSSAGSFMPSYSNPRSG